jgi:hypothetical protein
MDTSTWPWLVAVLGFIVLGGGIAYGYSRSRRRTPLERELNAAGSREVYREEEARPEKD